MHFFKPLFSIIFAALFITACGENFDRDYRADGAAVPGDIFIEPSSGDATNFIPFIGADSSSHRVSGLVYNGLLKYDKNLNLTGDLAEKWHISPDGLTLTFTLKKGITFHDGFPLSAHDVLATFNTLIDPKTPTPYAGDYQMVSQANVIDDVTFQVQYKEPFAPALSSWTMSILPKHILDKSPITKSTLAEHPIGTGPFKFKSWKRGQHIVLERNEAYFDHAPYLDELRIRIIPDVDTQYLELKAQQLDTMGLKPLHYTKLTNTPFFTRTFSKYKYLGNGYTYMGFNLKNPLFKDKEIRQALSYAVDRDALVRGVLMGQGLPLACPFKPGTWAYNKNINYYKYNPDKSKEILLSKGWKDHDNDGILDKIIDGKKVNFSFTVVTNQGNPLRQMTAELLQRYFADIGIKIDIRIQEWSTFIENTIHGRQFDAFILGWGLTPEPDPYDIFHSSKTENRQFNIVGFKNSEADTHMEAARRTFDQAKRKKHLDRFQEIVHDEQPYLFLYAPYALTTVHKRFKGIEEAPSGIGHNFNHWYVPAAQQLRITP